MPPKKSTKKLPEVAGAPPVPSNFPRPLSNRVIISASKPETKTTGGIIIPNSAQEQQNKGYIMAIGPKVNTSEYPTLKVGAIAVYGEYTGVEFEHEGREYLFVRDTDILYIL